jgi:hypothetical protein
MKRGYLVSWTRAAAVVGMLSVGVSGRAGVIDPPIDPKPGSGPSPEVLYSEVAARFAAIHQLSARLSTPEGVREYLAILDADDIEGFNRFTGDLKLPFTGKCWWVREMIDTIVASGGTERQCWLRDDLTAAERALYRQIALKYGYPYWVVHSGGLYQIGGHVVVPPGAFLKELEENNLVHCEDVPLPTIAGTRPMLGVPFRFCLEDPR